MSYTTAGDWQSAYGAKSVTNTLSYKLKLIGDEFEREKQKEFAALRGEVSRLEAENEFVRLKGRQENRKYEKLLQDAASEGLENIHDLREAQRDLTLARATIAQLSRELVAMRFSLAATELDRKKQQKECARRTKPLAARNCNVAEPIKLDPVTACDAAEPLSEELLKTVDEPVGEEKAQEDLQDCEDSEKLAVEVEAAEEEPKENVAADLEEAGQSSDDKSADESDQAGDSESIADSATETTDETKSSSRGSSSWQEVEEAGLDDELEAAVQGLETMYKQLEEDEDVEEEEEVQEVTEVDERIVCVDGIDLFSRQGLLDAAARGDTENVQQIFVPTCDFADFLPDILGAALSVASIGGHEQVVDTLIMHGADAAWTDSNGNTCLHTAASSSSENSAAIAQLLLTQNVGLNSVNDTAKLPVHVAAACGNGEVIKVLMLHGTNILALDHKCRTALQLAEAEGHDDAIAALTDPSALFWNRATFANLCYKESAMQDAILAYHDALDKSSTCTPLPTIDNLATIHLNCARAHAKLCQMVKSVEMCSQALELQPTYVSGLVQRAMVYMDLCAYGEAVEDFKAAVKFGGQLSGEYHDRYLEATRLHEASHFHWLGLPEDTINADDIKKAYRKLCMKWHPDKNQGDDEIKVRAANMFNRIATAHDIISDPVKRVLYRNAQHETESLKFARQWGSSFAQGGGGGYADYSDYMYE